MSDWKLFLQKMFVLALLISLTLLCIQLIFPGVIATAIRGMVNVILAIFN